MKKYLIVGAIFAFMAAPSARAEVPDYALDKDYQNCVGDNADSQRQAYCACVRDRMRQWDMDTYMQTAGQAAASANTPNAQPPASLTDIAKQCIAQVLK